MRRDGRARGSLGLAAAVMLVSGCAAGPGDVAEQAQGAGLTTRVETGTGYRHVLFQGRAPRAGETLRVYLDGDGRAWLTPRRAARDPTPRHSVALELMAVDPGPAVMVGRPCYHGLAADAGCSPLLWTHRRYAPEVVASLAAVISRLARDAEDRPLPVVLVGYSGGGTLAVLVAEKLEHVAGVITVAANLDVAAWARHHGFSPLAGSLDPAARAPLPAALPRLHLVGGRDDNVLAGWSRAYVAGRPGARLREVPGYDHHCCWAELWPAILAEWPARGVRSSP